MTWTRADLDCEGCTRCDACGHSTCLEQTGRRCEDCGHVTCPVCADDGIACCEPGRPHDAETCDHCAGAGIVYVGAEDPAMALDFDCPRCHGSGSLLGVSA